jgi:hypothetical protein
MRVRMLDIPVVTDVVIIKDSAFRCPSAQLFRFIINKMKTTKVRYLGTTLFSRFPHDTIPQILMSTGKEPSLFLEGGVYLVGDPTPYIITPEQFTSDSFLELEFPKPVWIYQVSFL